MAINIIEILFKAAGQAAATKAFEDVGDAAKKSSEDVERANEKISESAKRAAEDMRGAQEQAGNTAPVEKGKQSFDDLARSIIRAGGTEASFRQLGRGIALSLGGAVAGITTALVALEGLKYAWGQAAQSFGEALEEQEAVVKLGIAFKTMGKYSGEAVKDMTTFARELQSQTRFSNQEILRTSALLAQLGRLTGESLKEATRATADLAVGLGRDLRVATLIVAKAAQGSIFELRKYGLVVDNNVPKTQRWAKVLQFLQTTFGGAAQADLNAYTAQLRRLGNVRQNLRESFGLFVFAKLEGFIKGLTENLTRLDIKIRNLPSVQKALEPPATEDWVAASRAILQTADAIARQAERSATGLKPLEDSVKSFEDKWKEAYDTVTGYKFSDAIQADAQATETAVDFIVNALERARQKLLRYNPWDPRLYARLFGGRSGIKPPDDVVEILQRLEDARKALDSIPKAPWEKITEIENNMAAGATLLAGEVLRAESALNQLYEAGKKNTKEFDNQFQRLSALQEAYRFYSEEAPKIFQQKFRARLELREFSIGDEVFGGVQNAIDEGLRPRLSLNLDEFLGKELVDLRALMQKNIEAGMEDANFQRAFQEAQSRWNYKADFDRLRQQVAEGNYEAVIDTMDQVRERFIQNTKEAVTASDLGGLAAAQSFFTEMVRFFEQNKLTLSFLLDADAAKQVFTIRKRLQDAFDKEKIDLADFIDKDFTGNLNDELKILYGLLARAAAVLPAVTAVEEWNTAASAIRGVTASTKAGKRALEEMKTSAQGLRVLYEPARDAAAAMESLKGIRVEFDTARLAGDFESAKEAVEEFERVLESIPETVKRDYPEIIKILQKMKKELEDTEAPYIKSIRQELEQLALELVQLPMNLLYEAFAGVFEAIITDAENFSDAMQDLMKDLVIQVVKILLRAAILNIFLPGGFGAALNSVLGVTGAVTEGIDAAAQKSRELHSELSAIANAGRGLRFTSSVIERNRRESPFESSRRAAFAPTPFGAYPGGITINVSATDALSVRRSLETGELGRQMSRVLGGGGRMT